MKNGLWKIVSKSQDVVTKFNVTQSRLHCSSLIPHNGYSHFYDPSFLPDFVSILIFSTIPCKCRSIKIRMLFQNWLQTTYCVPEPNIKIEHHLILMHTLSNVCLLIFNNNAKQRKQKYNIEYKKKYKEKTIVKFRKSFVCHITMESK